MPDGPPVAVTFIEPLAPPLQLTFVTRPAILMSAGCVMVHEPVAVHPFASAIVNVYTPGARFEIVADVPVCIPPGVNVIVYSFGAIPGVPPVIPVICI